MAQMQRHSCLDAAHAGQVLAALVVAREVVLNDASSAAEPDPGPSRATRLPARQNRATATEDPSRSTLRARGARGRDSLGQLSGRLQKMPGSTDTGPDPSDERQAKPRGRARLPQRHGATCTRT